MARKSLVISNCQCLPLANVLGTNCNNMLFEWFGAHLVGPAEREQAARDLVARAQTAYEAIIAIPLANDWGPLSAQNIRGSFQNRPVITISNIHFAGWHPDLTYIGGLAARVVGPLGDYHSRLALFGFLRGLAPDACVALFRDDVFAAAGYYDTYDKSFAELRARDAELDCRVTDILERAMRRDLCFLSVNHPTTAVFAPFARRIATVLAKRGICERSDLPGSPLLHENGLANAVIFPIYPDVARRHGMPRLGSYAFKPTGSQANPLDLPAFVDAEFAAFEAVGRQELANTPLAAELTRIFAGCV